MTAQREIAETPLMKQYNAIKTKHPDALLLFRVGDFYETFGEDAIKTSKILGIVLTRRANGSASYIELAGFPYHSLDTYLPKLVRAGHRVAICDQLEDPKLAKKIVRRGVTELVTPGVTYNDNVLNHAENNFLACIDLQEKVSGISFLDVSTGEFFVAQGLNEYIEKLVQTLKPSEIIVQREKLDKFRRSFGDKYFTQTYEQWIFTPEFTHDLLLKHFKIASLKGFGIDEFQNGTIAAGVILHYLNETHHEKLGHISTISRIEEENYVWLDRFTIRNLELLSSANEKAVTLINVLDKTISPMGSRLLKRWMVLPLKNRQPLEERYEIVDYFLRNFDKVESLQRQLKVIGDLERLISKVSVGKINPREVLKISESLNSIAEIKVSFTNTGNISVDKLIEKLNPLPVIARQIQNTITPDPPSLINKGNVIAEGISEELDELRKIAFSGKDYLIQIQQREVSNTGIPSLKIGYNNVFGYYLEVTNTHKDKVPASWHRKQTLTGSERYITEELKDYEQKILGAEEKILALEYKLFEKLILSLSEYIEPIQLNAHVLAKIDVLAIFCSHCSK